MIVCDLSDLPQRMRKNSCLLGIDYGTKIIGIAVSDPGLCVASPLLSLAKKKFSDDAQKLAALVAEREAGGIVFGLPRAMDGRDSPMSQAVRAFVRNLSKQADFPDLPVAFWDERFSTAAVQRFLIEDDMTRKRRGEVVDKMAAAYILQGALDALRTPKLSS